MSIIENVWTLKNTKKSIEIFILCWSVETSKKTKQFNLCLGLVQLEHSRLADARTAFCVPWSYKRFVYQKNDNFFNKKNSSSGIRSMLKSEQELYVFSYVSI